MSIVNEVLITAPTAAQIAAAIKCLGQLGIVESSLVIGRANGKNTIQYYPDASIIPGVRSLRLPTGVKLSFRRLMPSDWETKWKRDFKPVMLTKNIRVVPAWCKVKASYNPKKDILLDTTSAFGTGLHPTTRMVAGYIEENSTNITSLLDVGTGSGILSIVAKKCGIKTICAFDNDPESVVTAKQNLKANHCIISRLSASGIENFMPKRKFDMVAANVLAKPLLENNIRIASWVKPGGLLAISGIWKGDIERFKTKFAQPGLKCISECIENEWAGLLYKTSRII
jgi:ribosomal protein L11 methyltransferase